MLTIFPFGHPAFDRLVSEVRIRVLEEIADSDLPGAVFTYVWALDHPGDKQFVDSLADIFRGVGGRVHVVELVATKAGRVRRNATALRLEHKPSKPDIEASRRHLDEADVTYRLNSGPDLDVESLVGEHYLRIDNTNLSPEEAASKIFAAFDLPVADAIR